MAYILTNGGANMISDVLFDRDIRDIITPLELCSKLGLLATTELLGQYGATARQLNRSCSELVIPCKYGQHDIAEYWVTLG